MRSEREKEKPTYKAQQPKKDESLLANSVSHSHASWFNVGIAIALDPKLSSRTSEHTSKISAVIEANSLRYLRARNTLLNSMISVKEQNNYFTGPHTNRIQDQIKTDKLIPRPAQERISHDSQPQCPNTAITLKLLHQNSKKKKKRKKRRR